MEPHPISNFSLPFRRKHIPTLLANQIVPIINGNLSYRPKSLSESSVQMDDMDAGKRVIVLPSPQDVVIAKGFVTQAEDPTIGCHSFGYEIKELNKKTVTLDQMRDSLTLDDNNIIAQGSTAIIYRTDLGTIPVAVKRIKSDLIDVYQNELKLWLEMRRTSQKENVHIVNLLCFWTLSEDEPTHYFMMELAKCDLGKRISEIQKRQLSEDELKVYKKQMKGFIRDAAKGLKWIHDSGILHRDIKPENVLIFETCGGTNEIAKLTDFGVSRKLSGVATGTNSCGRGTSDWMAPEPLIAIRDKKQFYSTKSIDIFSLGMTAHYGLTFGTHPFESGKYGTIKFMNIIDDDVRPCKLGPPEYSADHLLQWMMEKEGKLRPTINQVLSHPFFWDANKSLMFLVDVVRSVKLNDKRDRNLVSLREKIDQSYRERIEGLQEETSWKLKIKARLVDQLLKRKSKGWKEYNGESLLMLVELIRDKLMHSDDIQDELLSDEFFGEGGCFSDEKYMGYFLTTFPDMITFLFCALVNERRNPATSMLRIKYFSEFGNVPFMSA